MSGDRGIWFASTRWVQVYPITWQGWLLTLAYTVFILGMVSLAQANPAFVYGIIAFILVITGLYLRVIFSHLRPRQNSKGRDHA